MGIFVLIPQVETRKVEYQTPINLQAQINYKCFMHEMLSTELWSGDHNWDLKNNDLNSPTNFSFEPSMNSIRTVLDIP